MRYIFTTVGSFGDVAPLIVVALELKKRGHEIIFVVNPFHQKVLERWGFEVFPVGDAEQMNKRYMDPRINNPLKVMDFLLEASRVDCREQYQAFMDLKCNDGNTALVCRGTMVAPRLVEEKYGVPNCGIFLTGLELCGPTERSCFLGHIGNPIIMNCPDWMYRRGERRFVKKHIEKDLMPWIEEMREEIGLPPMAQQLRHWLCETTLPLMLIPDWFVRPDPELPGDIRQTGFMFLPTDYETPLEPELERFLDEGEAPVIISRGSALRYHDNLVKDVRDACIKLGQRSLLLSFDHEGPVEIDGDHCVSAPVSIGRVLPRGRALVHRGGIGAAADALRFGIPQLILGQSIDHPDNGERVTRLKAGRWMYTLTGTKGRLLKLLDAVLNDPEIQAGADAVMEKFDVEGWISESADLLESLQKSAVA